MGANNNMINLFKKYDVNRDDSDPIKGTVSIVR